jgi:hypothetical protein
MPPTVPNPEAYPTPGNTTLLTALASGPGRGSNGSGQLWPRRTSHRVRDSGPQGPARVHAGGRRTVGCRTPSEPQTAADTRMATTPARPRMLNTAFQTAAIQRAADGQSVDRSCSLQLPLLFSRPTLRPTSGRPPARQRHHGRRATGLTDKPRRMTASPPSQPYTRRPGLPSCSRCSSSARPWSSRARHAHEPWRPTQGDLDVPAARPPAHAT